MATNCSLSGCVGFFLKGDMLSSFCSLSVAEFFAYPPMEMGSISTSIFDPAETKNAVAIDGDSSQSLPCRRGKRRRIDPFACLPIEIVVHTLVRLPLADIGRLASVSGASHLYVAPFSLPSTVPPPAPFFIADFLFPSSLTPPGVMGFALGIFPQIQDSHRVLYP
ncbi:hypothetical protein TW95_gp0729 [Pandoravirus inopinatum]|uniref:F-box domain-containing protein n=1 Tax=Pandoravirus inopinatum TaxID=1605721 RepID=A0A0B5IXH2_9VIRU|nr:hypothetical protein TW95_gp0729 [Pandoravirus inopinatum]AJF97463.1 hypothetical protein [Pandoravirus inopinatum]